MNPEDQSLGSASPGSAAHDETRESVFVGGTEYDVRSLAQATLGKQEEVVPIRDLRYTPHRSVSLRIIVGPDNQVYDGNKRLTRLAKNESYATVYRLTAEEIAAARVGASATQDEREALTRVFDELPIGATSDEARDAILARGFRLVGERPEKPTESAIIVAGQAWRDAYYLGEGHILGPFDLAKGFVEGARWASRKVSKPCSVRSRPSSDSDASAESVLR